MTTIKLFRNTTGSTGEADGESRHDLVIWNAERQNEGGVIEGEASNNSLQTSIGLPWYSGDDFVNHIISIHCYNSTTNRLVAVLSLYENGGYILYRQSGTDYLVQGGSHAGGDKSVEVFGSDGSTMDIRAY